MSMNNTTDEVRAYFKQCKTFWMRQGDSEGIATCKAFWWDIVEVSNQHGWTPAKEQFALEFRGYKRGDPEPAASAVEQGAC